MTKLSRLRSVVLVGSWLAVSGCALEKADPAAERFREAVPDPSGVRVPGPEAQDGTGSTRQGLSTSATSTTAPAKYYAFTRRMRDGVNSVSAAVLGSIWVLVHTEPTSIVNEQAVWGPWTDSLEPATYRFRVREVAQDEYDYALEGRPKASQDEADFRAVLTGHGYGVAHEKHGDGWFEIDVDVARELDPVKNTEGSGTVRVVHDLPAEITRNVFALPKTISAEVKPSASAERFTVAATTHVDRTGELSVKAHADADDSHTTLLEDIAIASHWQADGAGRSDITLEGGDVPASVGKMSATECWGSDFRRVYYTDSVSYEPTVGEASACIALPTAD